MNHIYRLVWNHLTHAWVCCAETASGRGKTGSGRKSRVTGRVAGHATALATGALASSLALAGPTGGQVSAGAGSIAQSGHTTTITQTSQNLAINWQGFDIAANEAVRFNQPNAASVALNRVTGQNPSQILGSLSANGQVFVLNPNGVLFGAGAQVNVGGLVASTLGLSDNKLMAGSYTFDSSSRSIDGAVVNKGTLNSAPGGYIALLAPEVRNEGSISATQGTALLAAGKQITVNLNNGSLLGYHIDQGALKALADNQQLIQANGGTVILSAKAADALASAVVNNTGIIEARTLNKVGGVIKLMGDMDYGTVHVGGTLDASAGAFAAAAAPTNSTNTAPVGAAAAANGGTAQGTANGGFIETSAAHVKIADSAKITTAAANGLTGSWLIDPVDFTIAATGGDMTAATLTSNLASSNVLIQSTSGANGTSGNVNVNDAVSWSANKLTLNAQNNINLNANINASGTASLALEYGQGAVAAGNTSNYFLNNGVQVNLPAGQNFSTKLGSDGATTTYTVITALGAAGSSTTTDLQGMNGNIGGNYVLGANIDASPTSSWNTGAGFAPLGTFYTFTGNFDGLGHTINNLTINLPATNNVGLFHSTNGVIRNVGMVGGSVTGSNYVGGLMGGNFGSISNSYATGTVTGNSNVGGLVGKNRGPISTSYATGVVSGSAAAGATGVGGLTGWNDGPISTSYATGAVSGAAAVGGLVGRNSTTINTISTSYATGVVSGSSVVGGLVGYNYGPVNHSYATGAVSGTSNYIGGLVGYNISGSSINTSYAIGAVSGSAAVGGLVGANSGGISTSYATGEVTGSIGNVGGLAGYTSGSISTSYATGAVTGSNYVGGLSGMNAGSISTSYATGAVMGNSSLGGLVGRNSGSSSTVNTSYWDTTTSGRATSVGGIGMATTSMQTQANFTSATAANGNVNPNWDFTNTWVMYDGHTYPLLRSFMTPLTVTADNITKTYNGQNASASGVSYSSTPNANLLGTLGYSDARNAGTRSIGGLYSNQQGYIISYVGGTLTVGKADLTLSSSNVTKTYDGGLGATGTATVSSGTLFGSDSLAGGTFAFTDKNVGSGNKTVTATGVTVNDGNNGGNYNVSYADNTTSTINQLASVSWVGGSSGNWSTAANWAGGAIPDYANVAAVVIPAGVTVTHDSGVAGTTTLNSLTIHSGNTFNVSGGTLDVLSGSTSVATFNQSGGTVHMGGALTAGTFSQTGGTWSQLAASLPSFSATGFSVTGGTFIRAKGGDGSNATPYQLADIYGVQGMGSVGMLSKTYTQTNDIDASEAVNWNASSGFVPVGNPSATFTGSFDGQGHTISNLRINRPAAEGVGLFGVTGSSAVISHIGLIGSSVTGSSSVGTLLGQNSGSVNNAYAAGSVTGAGNVGTLVGYNSGGSISNVYATGSVSGNYNVGGLVGYSWGSISNAYASASVTGSSSVGGLMGSNAGTVTSSYWNTTTSGQSTSAGGTGKTSAQMMQSATFSGWDMATSGGSTAVWRIYEGHTAPLLRSFMTSLTLENADASVTYNGTSQSGATSVMAGVLGTAATGTNAGIYNGYYSNQQGYDITGGNLTINQLPSVSWTGGTSGNWSDSANWAGGITPNLANVAAVVIPAGVNVTYDSGVSGTTTLSSLTSSGKLTVAAGTLATTGNLSTAGFQQTGGTVNVGGNLDINTSSAIVMGNTHVTGNLSATTTGADISQTTGSSMSVGGTSSLIANSGSQRYGIVLNGVGNDFVGAVSVSSAKVKLVDSSGGLILGNIDAQGTANLISLGGDISQTAGSSMSVSNTTTLTAADMLVAGGARYNVTLGNSGNNFVGAVSADANQVTLVDGTGGLILGKIGGNVIQGSSGSVGQVNITSLGGDISQTAASIVNVSGSSNLVANNGLGQRYHITLANAGNDFGGAVSTNAANLNVRDSNALSVALDSTGSSTLNAAGALQLAGSVGGSLTVTNSGATSLSGTLSVNGANTTSANASVTVNGTAGAVIQ